MRFFPNVLYVTVWSLIKFYVFIFYTLLGVRGCFNAPEQPR